MSFALLEACWRSKTAGMSIQVLSFLMLVSLLGAPKASAAEAGCFDFSKKITQPLMNSPTLPEAPIPGISKKSGKLKTGAVWAAVRGEVARPIQGLIDELAAHQTT